MSARVPLLDECTTLGHSEPVTWMAPVDEQIPASGYDQWGIRWRGGENIQESSQSLWYSILKEKEKKSLDEFPAWKG
jgi:hypothetical protein